jgi:4-diphosphocytidyl-2-C-methyl-D-erythritol kinase
MEFELHAYGKINLALDVIGRRENGYHDVRMIMQTVKLYDKLKFARLNEDKIVITTNLSFLPVNEDNLVYKACRLIKDEYNITDGISIDIEKHIPVAAGMAGGSTDAAAALIAMNKMFELKITEDKLMKYGVSLGADVPYCIMRGTALSEGIGEVLTKLPPIPKCHILIAKPPVSVSTKQVYEALDSREISSHPDIDAMIEAIKNSDIHAVADKMGNVLEEVTVRMYPRIEELKTIMKENGALNAMMSGSGPTVFGIYDSRDKAVASKKIIYEKNLAKQLFVVSPFV